MTFVEKIDTKIGSEVFFLKFSLIGWHHPSISMRKIIWIRTEQLLVFCFQNKALEGWTIPLASRVWPSWDILSGINYPAQLLHVGFCWTVQKVYLWLSQRALSRKSDVFFFVTTLWFKFMRVAMKFWLKPLNHPPRTLAKPPPSKEFHNDSRRELRDGRFISQNPIRCF